MLNLGRVPFAPRRELRSSWVDELIALRASQAAGTNVPSVATLAASEMAAGLWERGMAAGVSDSLSAATLGSIGRGLVTRGESVWYVADDLSPVPASDWDVTSPVVRPAGWRYRLSLAGPSGHATRRDVPADRVLHFRINVDSRFPWRGRSPWSLATTTARLAAALESSLADEESGPVGTILPVPDLERSAAVADALPGLRGAAVLGETMAGGWEEGQARAPSGQDWQTVRVGPDPPDGQRQLREAASVALLAAAGVPADLIFPTSAGDTREAWRRFLFSTIAPVGRVVGDETRRVLGGSGRVDFAALQASDLQGRSRAFRQLTEAGMSTGDARRICGFDN